MSDFFDRRSPYLSLLCFGLPLVVTCFLRQWQYALVSLGAAMVVCAMVVGLRRVVQTMRALVGLFALMIVVNPLVSTVGTTELLFVNGRPITQEAILQGVSLGIMLMAVILWSSCWNHIMTEEKLSYIFKKFSPTVAVVLSMTLRLIPLYMRRWHSMQESHRALGLPEKGGLFSKVKESVICFSGLMDWGIENGRITATSMVARGACLDRDKEGT